MLEYINDPNDIKQIQPEDYKLLAKDIRRFLLRNVSRTGGHLASNLGIVELTMALAKETCPTLFAIPSQKIGIHSA